MGLHNAFTELLEKKRFENITVNELCERAMIRRTTFYKHFADKYEYFVFYCKEIGETFHRQLPQDLSSDNIESYFLQMLRLLFRFIFSHQELVNNIRESDLFPTLLYFLSEQIADDLVIRQQAGGTGSDPVLSESIAAFYSGGFLYMLIRWSEKKYPLDEDLFVNTLSQFIGEKGFEKLKV